MHDTLMGRDHGNRRGEEAKHGRSQVCPHQADLADSVPGAESGRFSRVRVEDWVAPVNRSGAHWATARFSLAASMQGVPYTGVKICASRLGAALRLSGSTIRPRRCREEADAGRQETAWQKKSRWSSKVSWWR